LLTCLAGYRAGYIIVDVKHLFLNKQIARVHKN